MTVLVRVNMRVGDRLPTLSMVIEDESGNPLDLTGAICRIVLKRLDGDAPLDFGLVILADPTDGVVVHDWGQVDSDALVVGVYDLTVVATYPDGRRVTVPTDQRAKLVVRDRVLA